MHINVIVGFLAQRHIHFSYNKNLAGTISITYRTPIGLVPINKYYCYSRINNISSINKLNSNRIGDWKLIDIFSRFLILKILFKNNIRKSKHCMYFVYSI